MCSYVIFSASASAARLLTIKYLLLINGVKKMKLMLIFVFTMMIPAITVAQQSTTKSMPFSQCLETIKRTAQQLGVTPVIIVNSGIMRMVRMPTDDGSSVLVTCSKPDQTMVMTVSKD
jgi:hypothetical protein